ncbi:ATP-binding cassette domain-containing protein [Paenirhodobacter populi]|uniref:ATP-binding cassette domain-containing protein n=1 Tax=Paenirhodobacter populi TaxID=2306993 RepID=UPI00240DC296|nr:ATP-binding cassette domain-containing protein [Sinirhodobacter populi]
MAELGLESAGDRRPYQLSGGMAQRVAFAAARAAGARIVVADEPTRGLDVARRDDVIELLMREVREGGALLTITHDLALARRMGGGLAVVLKGKVVERGPADQVLTNPQHDYSRRLIVSHDPDLLDRTADRVVSLDTAPESDAGTASRGVPRAGGIECLRDRVASA